MSSSIYIFNDLIDLPRDKLHPIKKYRPIASEKITTQEAKYFLSVLLLSTIAISIIFNFELFLILLIYLIINIFYSLILKEVFLLDMIIIATGFVLRLFAGAVVVDISLSSWIIIITFLLASFLAISKRMDNVNSINQESSNISKIYTERNIKSIILILSIILVGSYISFTMYSEIITKYNITYLPLNSVLVIIGVLRYLYIIFNTPKNYDPIAIFFGDTLLKLIFIIWIVSFYILSVL
jgi:4-hydroxybenzoate polyprenyltransferase